MTGQSTPTYLESLATTSSRTHSALMAFRAAQTAEAAARDSLSAAEADLTAAMSSRKSAAQAAIDAKEAEVTTLGNFPVTTADLS